MTFGGRGSGIGRTSRLLGPSADQGRVPPERRGRTVRGVLRFFKPYRRPIFLVLLTIIVTSLLGIVNPYLLKLLIDEAFPRRDFELLTLYVGLMIAVPIVSGLIGVGQSYLNNVIGQRVIQDLRNSLYTHLQQMPLRFFTETRTGEIQSRLANDVGGIQSVVTDTASSVFSNLVVVLSTIAAMLLIDWRLTALSLAAAPFFMILTYRVGKIRRRLSGQTQQALAEISAVTEETVSVSGMLLTKTFGQQATAIDRYRDLNASLAALQIRQHMVGRWFFMIVGTVFSVIPALVYFLAGALTIQGDPTAPTIGDIVAFTTLQSRLFFPLGQLLNIQVEVQGALALFDRIFEYLDMEPEIVDAPDAIDLEPTTVRGEIRFRDVSFSYPVTPRQPQWEPRTEPSAAQVAAATEGGVDLAPQASSAFTPRDPDGDLEPFTIEGENSERARSRGRRPSQPFALQGIDFTVEPGQLVALVGASGSGKTTTTYLLPRLYDVTEGAVEIDGVDVRQISLASLGQVIGFVTQETYLFHASVGENLRYARPSATDRELRTAARLALIHDRIRQLPEGYDTVVGERGYKLSGGEKQRMALARVLLKDPRILVLDEATSALDTVSERLIQTAIERVMRGRTTVAIAHRLSTILRADQILVYDQGRIVERGTHPELLRLGGIYARLYREQFAGPTNEGVDSAT